MINEKIKGYISIAKKAGYLILGADNLKGYNKKLYLVLADKEGGKNLLKIADSLKEQTKDQVYFVDNLETLSQIYNCKILGIKNLGISEQIIKLLRSENFGKKQ